MPLGRECVGGFSRGLGLKTLMKDVRGREPVICIICSIYIGIEVFRNPFTAIITLTSVTNLSSKQGRVHHPPLTKGENRGPQGSSDLPSFTLFAGRQLRQAWNWVRSLFDMPHCLYTPRWDRTSGMLAPAAMSYSKCHWHQVNRARN